MATDETATTAAGECQIEASGERVDVERSQMLAPACGLTHPRTRCRVFAYPGGGATINATVFGLKWVPNGAA